MKMDKKSIGILVAVLTVGVAALAFAYGGYGGRYMTGSGYAGNMMGYGPGYRAHGNTPGAWGNLPDKDAAALKASQEKFFNHTRDLRNQIEEKQIALNNELAGATPDEGKVAQLQKELSGLQAQFNQKSVAHQMEVRNLLPKNFNGNAYGQGYGSGGYCTQ